MMINRESNIMKRAIDYNNIDHELAQVKRYALGPSALLFIPQTSAFELHTVTVKMVRG